ncbi:MAG: glutamate--tRNA ligase [Candidatus Babeliaceae bacterium]
MMEKSAVRVRFAPSPTGHLHIGGLRSALFNWLFARHNKGVFLLRIEDTDRERSKQEYLDAILAAFTWCDLQPDEPPIIQSDRIKEHQAVAQRMLQEGTAYRCYCTQEDLVKRLGQNAAHDAGYAFYDRKCRDLKPLPDDVRPFVIRFKVPLNCAEITFNDLIHGPVTFPADQFDDFIIVRSDGWPMYNFVVVVDDAFMHITHVIRGDDHISNTPKQILLYQACGFTLPQFAHVPMILGPDGQRLSKRHAATSVLDYKQKGFLADALCNYLVRLGWSHGDQEIFSRTEMIDYFSLDHIGKKGAIFDSKKLEWLNGHYMRQKSAAALCELIQKDIDSAFQETVAPFTLEQLYALVDLYKERAKTLVELRDELYNVVQRPLVYETAATVAPQTMAHIVQVLEKKLMVTDFLRPELEIIFKGTAAELGIPFASLAQVVRNALIGKLTSPSIYDLMIILGKHETLERIRRYYAHYA